MNRQIRRLAAFLMVCYVLLFSQLNVLQVFRADEYNDDPRNNRQVVRDFTRPRGSILTADGAVAAESIPVDDRYELLRTYPNGPLLAAVTGYFSFKYGTDGIERQYNDVLAGQTDGQKIEGWTNLLSDEVNTGDVLLTVRADIQRVAREALGDREGSVVALDPRTGAVLALWSYPSFDPNGIATHDFEAARVYKEALDADPAKPLLVNAYRERYMPGSTFKIVTTAGSLEAGVTSPETVYPVERSWTPPGTTRPIRNFGNLPCGGDLLNVFRLSCNVPFAQMGVDMGPERMVATAERFGYNAAPPIDLPRPAKSFFPPVEAFAFDTPKLAQVSFGQNDVQSTPLETALEAAAVANNGVIMAPYVVAETRDRDGDVLSRATPTAWKQAMEPETAAWLRSAMVEVARNGTARCCMQLASGAQAAAKTGTAQLGTDPPASHAWITTFAPAENPRVVVTVFVKATPEVTAGTGGTVAGPVAKRVLDAVLATPDPLAAG
jgi:peptidoglycan glycosyltransferase